MLRGISLVLAMGLVILWLVGLSHHATAWLTWLDGLGALFGFAIAAVVVSAMERGIGSSATLALGIGLGVLWIIGRAEHRETWLVWWTFVFACAYFLLGLGSGIAKARRPSVTRTAHPRPA